MNFDEFPDPPQCWFTLLTNNEIWQATEFPAIELVKAFKVFRLKTLLCIASHSKPTRFNPATSCFRRFPYILRASLQSPVRCLQSRSIINASSTLINNWMILKGGSEQHSTMNNSSPTNNTCFPINFPPSFPLWLSGSYKQANQANKKEIYRFSFERSISVFPSSPPVLACSCNGFLRAILA